jgi:hypothetical protein
MKWIFLILFVAGGIYFLAASITNKKTPRWVSLTNGMIGLLLVAKGFSKLLEPSQIRTFFTCISGGLILGMFFCLGVSGNIGKKKKSQLGNREVRETPTENLTE